MMATRPDLSQRTGLSKSELNRFEWCPTESWYAIHDPRPFVPVEQVTFGSAVDRGAELYIVAARAAGEDLAYDQADLDLRAFDAAMEKAAEDAVDVDPAEVRLALTRFRIDVLPTLDWSRALTQHHINVPLDDLGEVDGHPDIILAGDEFDDIWDVKTGGKWKMTARTLELGFYALMREAETGRPVRYVGFLSYNRGWSPRSRAEQSPWRRIWEPVTDEFRRWTYEGAAAYVRAKKADEIINRNATEPVNATMVGGPAWAGQCATCAYAPVNGGPCVRAFREEVAA